MNLARFFTGCLKALGRDADWTTHFDLSRRGFQLSFVALLLSLPCYYVGAAAINAERATTQNLETVPSVPLTAMMIVLVMYLISFSLCAYILAMVFDRQDRYRPWVIIRHWCGFFLALIGAALFGLSMTGLLPFIIAAYAVLALYLTGLAVDIRLAQKIVGFEWGAAIIAACLITAMGMTIILIGMSYSVPT